MKKAILIACTLIAWHLSQSQITPAWTKFPAPCSYQNYDDNDVFAGVDTLNNIYTAASVLDTINDVSKTMIVKHNSAGVQQWLNYHNPGSANYDTYARAIKVDKAGNSYVCGYGYHNNTTTKDFMVLKYDNAGNQLWAQYWDGGQNDYDYITCATLDLSGNIIVAGYAQTTSNTGNDIAVVKWSSGGTMLWSYTYNNSPANGEDRALAITNDVGGNIFVTGSSYGTSARDMIVIKLNSAGTSQWVKRVPHGSTGDDNYGYDITTDILGNSYATGSVSDWATYKFDPTGNLVWTNDYTTNGLDRFSPKKVMIDRFGNLVSVGDAFVSSANQSDLVIRQLSITTGAEAWSVEYNYGGIDHMMDMTLDTLGYIYVAGTFEGPQGTDMSTTILMPNGNTVWNSTYTNPVKTTGVDKPYKIVVDWNRNTILAGVSETRGNNSDDAVDVIVLKYATVGTGINEKTLDASFMNIYPNPSKGILNISITNAELIGSTVSVMNLTGQTIATGKINAFTQTMHLEKVASGIYFINITNNKGMITKKLVIE